MTRALDEVLSLLAGLLTVAARLALDETATDSPDDGEEVRGRIHRSRAKPERPAGGR
jgi:hypothetical protein